MRSQIKQARSEGYSDPEILNYLSSKKTDLNSQIESAKAEGYSESEVLDFLAKEPGKLRSLLSAPVKGIAKGLVDIAQLGVPLAFEDEPFEERQKTIAGAREAQGKIESGLEEALPTRDEFAENVLERGGRLLPSTAIGSGGLIGASIRSLAAGFGGEATKEMGGGPVAQSVAEIMAMGAPGFGKKILASKSQKPIVEFARKMGLSEEEITPFIQGEKKGAFWAKLAQKKGKTQEALSKSFKAAGGVFEDLKNSPLAQKPMSQSDVLDFLNDTKKELGNLPATVRQQVMPDYVDFVRSIQSGKANAADLMNLWSDLNYGISQGTSRLGILKGPIENAIKRGYPGFYEDFSMANQLYKRYFPLAKKLRPGIADELISAGELGGVAYGMLKGNFGILSKIFGVEVGRKIARGMLINPRMQNLHKQMLKAANERKFGIVLDLAKKIEEEAGQD